MWTALFVKTPEGCWFLAISLKSQKQHKICPQARIYLWRIVISPLPQAKNYDKLTKRWLQAQDVVAK